MVLKNAGCSVIVISLELGFQVCTAFGASIHLKKERTNNAFNSKLEVCVRVEHEAIVMELSPNAVVRRYPS